MPDSACDSAPPRPAGAVGDAVAAPATAPPAAATTAPAAAATAPAAPDAPPAAPATAPVAADAAPAAAAAASAGQRQGLAALALGAIGVVYGDIGTSPLYTMREVFLPATGVPLAPAQVIGAVSTVLWALMLVVTLKYVILILRADNRGEGGVLALTALARSAVAGSPRLAGTLVLLGVGGATLFYGDSVITPAITVLGAIEGLEILTPALAPAVVPLALVVLLALFVVQRRGTAFVGRLFGPVLVIWFVTLAVSGALQVLREPSIVAALDPRQAAHFLATRGWHLFAAVGAIVLALTGAEALYADMGHFGARPIRIAWGGLVLPSLALNYMGQGALLIAEPAALANPFFRLFPESLVLPAVLLATLAAIIASQSVISGAYSMTRQAIQLGFLPRMAVRFTSAREAGQIYVPAANWVLLAGVVAATVGFGSSSALAGAYGIAVTLTMMVTTLLTYFVVRHGWRQPAPLAFAATGGFLALDALLVSGCAIKFFDGGWFPLALGGAIFVVMSTWAAGRRLLLAGIRREGLELDAFVEGLDVADMQRAARSAVYPVADPTYVPQALLHNLKHNQVLHECNVVLHVVFETVPWVEAAARVRAQALAKGFWRVTLHYGFMETPDVPAGLAAAAVQGLRLAPFETSYFLSRETVVPMADVGMMRWRQRLFAAINQMASGVAGFFRLPDNAVVELGTRVQL